MASSKLWTCRDSLECVGFVGTELARRHLVVSWAGAENPESVVRICKSCSRSDSPKKCKGWVVGFTGSRAVVLSPLKVNGRQVQLRVEGFLDFRHTSSASAVDRLPCGMCTASMAVSDAFTGHVLARQHLDLANQGQVGSLWHLQAGGIYADEYENPLEWLDVPRWPATPTDFILLIELALYNFHWDTWNELRNTNPWQLWVKRSEAVVLSHYVEHLAEYQSRPSAHDSWLAAQCNLTSGWNPRRS